MRMVAGVVALVGLWHGPAWRFVVWGAAQGVCVAVDVALRTRLRLPRQPRTIAGAVLGWFVTLVVLVPTAPLFFCATALLFQPFTLSLFQYFQLCVQLVACFLQLDHELLLILPLAFQQGSGCVQLLTESFVLVDGIGVTGNDDLRENFSAGMPVEVCFEQQG